MMKQYSFVRDIFENRGTRIGASEVPCLFPDPERPTESVAGYGKTAITLYQEKVGERERSKAGLAAEMGHYLEPKAVELFIREVWGYETGKEWLKNRMDFEMNGGDPKTKQTYPILYNTAFMDDDSIVHPDGLHVGEKDGKIVKTKWGFPVDTRKDFLIEAKSATYFSAKRGESEVKGYDEEVKDWQGIPLKHWFQCQFQMLKSGVNLDYLVLIKDTSDFNVWEVRADKEMMRRIAAVVKSFMRFVRKHEMPKGMAINLSDIMEIYPVVKKDFATVQGESEEKVRSLVSDLAEAKKQQKAWEDKANDLTSALAVYLKDDSEIQDSEGNWLCKWVISSGFETCRSYKTIKTEHPEVAQYLKKKGLVYTTEPSRRVSIPRTNKPKKENKE